jgi:DNA-nicking Smr family endonuclease
MTSSTHQGPPRRRSRQLDIEERRLWKAVARTVKPMHKADVDIVADDPPPPPPPPAPSLRREQKAVAPVAVRAKATKSAGPPTLAPLDRRERHRLARGSAAIDARIDLHGLTQAQAHAALLRFLHRARHDGARFALVITGKGARFAAGDGERGLLKRQVPHWLQLPEFREHVVGFEDAHAVHGGEGALYVRLRRPGR